MTGPAPGCGCDPPWPALVVHAGAGAGDIRVEPAAAPGPLACLYYARCARCARCEAACHGPFRALPRTRPGQPDL